MLLLSFLKPNPRIPSISTLEELPEFIKTKLEGTEIWVLLSPIAIVSFERYPLKELPSPY
jgi:hypothetical protein